MLDPTTPSPSGAPPGLVDWRKVVEASLKGRDFDSQRSPTRNGFSIEPLYARRNDTEPLPGRGARPWAIVQPVDDPDPDRANEQALADISGGATGLSLRFAGSPAAGAVGLPPTHNALSIALEGVDLGKVHLRLELSSERPQSVVELSVLAEKSGIAPELAEIGFGLDPLALVGESPRRPEPEQLAGLFSFLRKHKFRGPLACLDARPLHEAGASEAQELGGALGIAAWWLRELAETDVGRPPDVMSFFGASLSVDRDVLLSLAKLRALQLLWARLQELCGAPPTHLPVHAETSRRMLTRADPHSNLLRNTMAAFAAATGGADSILVQSHTAALGLADANARGLARNIQHLLIEEADVSHVSDPGAGSGAIEAMTDALAERAWAEFQMIEREGGIVASIQSSAFPARIASARKALAREVREGTTPLVGSTVYRAAEPAEAEQSEPEHPGPLAPIRLEALARAAA